MKSTAEVLLLPSPCWSLRGRIINRHPLTNFINTGYLFIHLLLLIGSSCIIDQTEQHKMEIGHFPHNVLHNGCFDLVITITTFQEYLFAYKMVQGQKRNVYNLLFLPLKCSKDMWWPSHTWLHVSKVLFYNLAWMIYMCRCLWLGIETIYCELRELSDSGTHLMPPLKIAHLDCTWIIYITQLNQSGIIWMTSTIKIYTHYFLRGSILCSDL